MLISSISRQCVLKLKDYSDKKANGTSRTRDHSNASHGDDANSTEPFTAPLNQMKNTDYQSLHGFQDNSWLGRLLNCKPCKQVTDNHRDKTVGDFIERKKSRKLVSTIV